MSAALIVAAVGDTIVKFGAYAGYASILGLAVMSLLYFAQAREVKRLREWAGRSPERDAGTVQRMQPGRVVAQPMSPATTAAQQAEAARTAAAAALYAKVPPPPPPPAPLVGPPGQLARPAVPGAATPAPAGAPGATATPPPAPGTVPAAVTAAAAAANATRTAAVLGNGAGQETHESDAARPEPLPAPDLAYDDDDGGFSPRRTGLIIGGAVAAVLVSVVLMVALTQDSPTTKPNGFGQVTTPASSPASPGGTSTNASAAAPTAVNRRATSVAVLNGTTQSGLARAVADEVEKARFTIALTETNADQAVTTTTVAYRPGQQRAAQIVAQVIGIDKASVQPVDANASVAADADVIVIVGADKIG
jgi:hypothetical protein